MGNEINISVAEMKAKLSEKIRACRELDRTFVITSHGKPRAVLISYQAYIGLAEEKSQPKKIDLKTWKKNSTARKEIARDIRNLFDEKKLSRKGQKGYKRRAVKLMEGNIGDQIVDNLRAYKFKKSGADGIDALVLMELGEDDQEITEKKAYAADVLDAMDHIRIVRERVTRQRLSKTEASELIEKFIRS